MQLYWNHTSAAFLQNTFSEEHLWRAASGHLHYNKKHTVSCFLSLFSVIIHQFHSYTKNVTVIPFIPTPSFPHSQPDSHHSHPDSLRSHPDSPHSHPFSLHSHPDSPHSHPYSLHSHPDSLHSHPYSPHSHLDSPHSHPYSSHSHLIHRIPRIPTLIPRISIIPFIPFPNSPFRLLQIALSSKLNVSQHSKTRSIRIGLVLRHQAWLAKLQNTAGKKQKFLGKKATLQDCWGNGKMGRWIDRSGGH